MTTKLQAALNQKGITSKGCANLLGITEKTLTNKMSGRTDFTYREIRRLKTFMPEYDIDYLLSDVGCKDSA